MANIKSQIKRNRTNEAARLRNKSVKSSLKTAVRRVRTAVAAGDVDTATTELVVASRSLDQAASKGIITATRSPSGGVVGKVKTLGAGAGATRPSSA